MCRLKKKVAVLLCIVTLSLTVTESYAQANVLALPLVQAGAAVTGISLGGVLAVTLAVVAVAYGTYTVVKNWDTITDSVSDMAQTASGWASGFWEDAKARFKNPDTGAALSDDIMSGTVGDIKDYVLPSDETFNIDMSSTMMSDVAGVIAENQGLEKLEPYEPTSIADIERFAVENYFTTMNENWMDYDNYVSYKNTYSGQYIIVTWNNADLLADKMQINEYVNMLTLKGIADEYIYKYTGTIDKRGFQYLKEDLSLSGTYSHEYLGAIDAYAQTGIFDNVVGAHIEDLLYYATGDLITHYDTADEQKAVSESVYDIADTARDGMSISVNPYLYNELSKIRTITGEKSTDAVMEAVANADAKAREDYQEVISDPVIEQSPAVNVDIPVLSDIWTWLQNLWSDFVEALKGVLEWLFVPDALAFDEFITAAENIINQNGNILTYPIQLVIRFLTEILSLNKTDCIMTIPAITFKGKTLYSGTTFNFTAYVNRDEFKDIYHYYILFTNAMMIIYVCNLAIKKGDEIMRGN